MPCGFAPCRIPVECFPHGTVRYCKPFPAGILTRPRCCIIYALGWIAVYLHRSAGEVAEWLKATVC